MDDIKQILEPTIYCNIATVCSDGTPWNTPVFFGYDDQLNIYWRSWTKSLHSQNLTARPDVAITVYNTQVPWGEGQGVYFVGQVTQIDDQKTIENALQIMDRRSGQHFTAQEFMNPNPRRIYRFTPEKVWRNVDGEENGKFIDTREKVAL